MNLNEDKEKSQSENKVESKQWKAWEKNLLAGAICFTLGLSGPIAVSMNIKHQTNKAHQETVARLREENKSLKKQLENQKEKTVAVPVATASVKPSKEAAPVTDAPAAEPTENTYDNNEYYDIVETSTYKSSGNYTSIVHKVLAKKNVSLTGTILAYAEDGSVIGKSSDDIELTAGQTNFLHYSFDKDISNATLKMNAQANDPGLVGARNAVEMEQYNQSDDELYITFKQTADKLGPFAMFKLLFYKDDKIVATESGYFSIYAKNLIGNGTTDVAKIWVYNTNYDRFEYIFEP